MRITQPRASLLLLAAWAALSPGSVLGRDADQAANLYSRGVHAYFAGQAADAEGLLSRALELNDLDPRIYYFRGFSRLQLGRDTEARADMAAGASLEANRMNRFAVGAALQRVQGSHRILLEQYRRQARSRAATVEAAVARQWATQMAARDAGVLRKKVVIPLDELLRPGGPQQLSTDEVARRSALMRQNTTRPAPTSPSAAPAAAASNDNPFRDDAEAAQEPMSRPQSSPATKPPVEDADDNPFGDF